MSAKCKVCGGPVDEDGQCYAFESPDGNCSTYHHEEANPIAAMSTDYERIAKITLPLINVEDMRMLSRVKITTNIMARACSCGNCATCTLGTDLEDFLDKYANAIVALVDAIS